MHTVLIGSPDDVRVTLFQESLLQQGYSPAEVVAYHDIITGKQHLAQVVQPGSIVRIESPGKDFAANRLLLWLGVNQTDEAGDYNRMTQAAVDQHREDKGQILVPRQWYLGLRAFLQIICEQLAECPPHYHMNHPDDITLMFDKCLCHAHLQTNHVAVPKALPTISSFDELETQMLEHGMQRVFVKLAHGSSASGVVAYQTNGTQHRATTAIEIVRENDTQKLYNTRRIKTYDSYAEIAQLIDTLCQHRVHVEQWIPKARMDGKAFDLRVVVIDGKAAHTIARLSDSPMTNLHLLNERRQRETVIEHLGATNFAAVMVLCEQAMQCFPKSLYAGIDVLIASGMRQHYVIEMNAFGDLLKDAFYGGLSPYALEIQRMAQHEHA